MYVHAAWGGFLMTGSIPKLRGLESLNFDVPYIDCGQWINKN